MTAKKTTKATIAKAPAKTKPAKAKPAAKTTATPAPEANKPDIIDAGGGILVEIAPSPAKPAKGKFAMD